MTTRQIFEAIPENVRAVRHHVAATLKSEGCGGEALRNAVACASEIATNAIVHGQGPISVTMWRNPNFHIEIEDCGEGTPHIVDADDGSERGRGLRVVGILASAWGVEPRDHGKAVWYEIAC